MSLILGVIPARIASTRLPGKLLLDLGGMSVLERAWRQVCQAKKLNRVIIAAGDQTIATAARAFGAEVVEVFDDLPSGSDRVAAAAKRLDSPIPPDVIVNIQGDEPFLEPAAIDAVVEMLRNRPEADVATAVTPLRSRAEFEAASAVKAVLTSDGRALYFSRSPIPSGWTESAPSGGYRHLGLYGYRPAALEAFVSHPPAELEKLEKLEQLRLLDLGFTIVAAVVEDRGVGIDTKKDLEFARTRVRQD